MLISRCSRNMIGSNASQNMGYSRGKGVRTPSKIGSNVYSQKSPKAQGGTYRNDVSPFRGRFGSNVRPSRAS